LNLKILTYFFILISLCFRFGGTEAAIFCCLTTIGKQLQHENVVDISLYAKLYHNQRPGIWKEIVS